MKDFTKTTLLYCLAALSIFLFSQPVLPTTETEVQAVSSDPVPTASLALEEVSATPTPTSTPASATPSSTPKPVPTVKATPSPTVTPSSSLGSNLSVSFISQAPFGVWDDLHEDACEEASLLMVVLFREERTMTTQQADDELVRLVGVEEGMGWAPSITLDKLATLADQEYGLKKARIESASLEKLISELDAGRPIIIPAAGRDLGNPHFQHPGPIYHMLVLKGYDPDTDQFIANDPGTRHGADFRYDSATLLNAIHDYDAGEDIEAGSARYLVFD